jgi:hypothetical protein
LLQRYQDRQREQASQQIPANGLLDGGSEKQ